jgi:hypothetical protein
MNQNTDGNERISCEATKRVLKNTIQTEMEVFSEEEKYYVILKNYQSIFSNIKGIGFGSLSGRSLYIYVSPGSHPLLSCCSS